MDQGERVDDTRWFEARISFEAASFEDAEMVIDRVALTICQGHGEGMDHVCEHQFVIGGPKEIPAEAIFED
jgi:hypothetical protein